MKHIDIMVTNNEGAIRSMTPTSAKVLGFDSDELVGSNFLELLEGRKDTDHIGRLFDEAGEAELMLAIAKEFGYSVLDEWMVDEDLNVLPCSVYVYAKLKSEEFVWVIIPRRGPLDGAPLSMDPKSGNLIVDLSQRGGKVFELSRRDLSVLDAFMGGDTDAEIAGNLGISKGAVRYSLRRMMEAGGNRDRKGMRRDLWYSISDLVIPDTSSYKRGEHDFYTQKKHIDKD